VVSPITLKRWQNAKTLLSHYHRELEDHQNLTRQPLDTALGIKGVVATRLDAMGETKEEHSAIMSRVGVNRVVVDTGVMVGIAHYRPLIRM